MGFLVREVEECAGGVRGWTDSLMMECVEGVRVWASECVGVAWVGESVGVLYLGGGYLGGRVRVWVSARVVVCVDDGVRGWRCVGGVA